MKNIEYKLKIPSLENENEFSEFIIETPQEVADKLKVSITTVYRILKGEYKYSHLDKKYLEGIQIEKIVKPLKQPRRIKKSVEEIKTEKIDFRKTLLESLQNKK